jgi:threonine dehydrogenase-like Zn-dependent dehydrogenase
MATKVQQAFVISGSTCSLCERPVPTPAAGEALVRVLIAGVCNTDLEIMKGYMGFHGVIGHEFVGLVESAPEGHAAMVGKRVVGDINLACGQQSCCTCSRGGDRARNHCPNRTVLGILGKDGTYAGYLTLPVPLLHLVPDSVSTENAAFAEPLAAACRIVEQRLIAPGEAVAVVGDGKLGLLIAEVLARYAADNKCPPPVLVGRHPDRLRLLPSVSGLRFLPSADASPTHDKQFDVVVDATGSPDGLALCTALTRPMGTLVLKSTCAAGASFNTAPFVIDELKIAGAPQNSRARCLKVGRRNSQPRRASLPAAS